jgi:hypothetical protein
MGILPMSLTGILPVCCFFFFFFFFGCFHRQNNDAKNQCTSNSQDMGGTPMGLPPRRATH